MRLVSTCTCTMCTILCTCTSTCICTRIALANLHHQVLANGWRERDWLVMVKSCLIPRSLLHNPYTSHPTGDMPHGTANKLCMTYKSIYICQKLLFKGEFWQMYFPALCTCDMTHHGRKKIKMQYKGGDNMLLKAFPRVKFLCCSALHTDHY